jgi:ArsR family transcriptional regulator, arsenate/arsenite/antimonite-responsive transcriptional repressor / arsenate reductase (thioredoxin)
VTLHHELDQRAARHAALGDPVRLAVVDELTVSDRAPVELRRRLGIESNLLAHHLDVLEQVGLVERSRSSGDGRRRYVHLRPEALGALAPSRPVEIGEALFVCTANSARSQLAAAVWREATGARATSAGTHPADAVDPGAARAAQRHHLGLGRRRPRSLDTVEVLPPLVVTVCDRAHEELRPDPTWLHWSIPDPVVDGRDRAFDAVVAELRQRVASLQLAAAGAP